jgi:FkbM family methyltransferase
MTPTPPNTTPYSIVKTLAKLLLGRGVHPFYSQSGEDAIVQSALKSKSGVYVDVGAYHPILYSNTYALYRRGWTGVVIDPNTLFKRLYDIFRPKDRFVQSGIAEEEGTLLYHRFNDAAYNTFDVASAKEYEGLRWLRLIGTDEVAVRPLSAVLAEKGVTHIDFLNVDVEGKDLEVLRSHDWNIPTLMIAVEDRNFNSDEPHLSPTYVFLRDKGYVLSGLTRDTLMFTFCPGK